MRCRAASRDLCGFHWPHKSAHVATPDRGFFRETATVADLPDLMSFVLTNCPMVFVRVDVTLVEYAFADSRTVGEAKAELGLTALLQSYSQLLCDLPDEFEVRGVARQGGRSRRGIISETRRELG
jgi:hypothetical protein